VARVALGASKVTLWTSSLPAAAGLINRGLRTPGCREQPPASTSAGGLERQLGSSVTWAVAVGLVVSKLVGISAATLLALRLRVGRPPGGMASGQVVGVAAIAGIGFAVSLLVADLAFTDPALTDAAKVGIFLVSLVAARSARCRCGGRRRRAPDGGTPAVAGVPCQRTAGEGGCCAICSTS
jgi:hypothetical protein